jgi:hypothetical protein
MALKATKPAQTTRRVRPAVRPVFQAKIAAPAPQHPLAGPLIAACQKAAKLPRHQLLAHALALGCSHYATLWPDLTPTTSHLPQEVLGCALLRGPADVETFQAIRCGAMLLSDLANSPAAIAAAAHELGVTGRVAHLARLGLAADAHADYWTRILTELPVGVAAETDFLPGISRLTTETRLSGPGRGPVRTWLRTHHNP